MYIYIYIYIFRCIYIYIYTYRRKEFQSILERKLCALVLWTVVTCLFKKCAADLMNTLQFKHIMNLTIC